jgi:hypothetical protein
MGKVLARRDFAGQRSTDQTDLLQAILMAEMTVTHGARMTIGQLLHNNESPDNTAALERGGIRRIRKRSKVDVDGARKEFLFVCTEAVRTKLLQQTDFAGLQIDQMLLRIKGATRDRQRLGGSQFFSGVCIPWAAIGGEFPDGDDDEHDDRTQQREF